MQAEVNSWIEESLSTFKSKDLPNCVPLLKSWQGRLSAVSDWYERKTDEFEQFTETIVRHYSDENQTLSEADVVFHDHTYCLNSFPKPNYLFVPHHCDFCCWKKGYLLDDWSKYNTLEVPLRLGWQRVMLCRTISSVSRQVDVYYVAPCGRRLRSMEEIFQFLVATKVDTVDISQFTFDHLCSPYTDHQSFTRVDVVYVSDISLGKEKRPISCMNTYNREIPDCLDAEKFEYTTCRTHEANVHIPTDKEFMVCCSCTDDCVNRSQCECWQLTIQEAQVMRDAKHSVGYVHHRLKRPQPSAIYECNKWCKCSPRCTNRVVQKGIQHRLQVFHTGKPELRWGLRTLDDIPKGDFVCIYIGHIYTEQVAEQKAFAYGDEYFADLDYIEVMEHHKEGYESDVAMSQSSSTTSDAIDQISVCSMESSNSTNIEPNLHNNNTFHTISISSDSEEEEMEEELRDTAEEDPSVLTNSPKVMKNADTLLNSSAYSSLVAVPKLAQTFSCPVFCYDTASKLSCLPPQRFQGMRTRKHYHEDFSYIMDAKTKGNVGRYINHSCSPNMFVQNVFIDTHDLRFPWVAFFAKRRIEAMSELTWDYNYDVGSVENKVICCLCGAANCKGRLL